ncbi:oligosaccharide flippase family protein [Lutibacter sp.]|uniref:oligosaccharide flippase family protein n=1 Tax=Lutibacter sp. TaxID=1925666 RepID=UPI003568BE7D
MNKQKIYKFSENTLSLFTIKGLELGLTIWLIPYLIFKVGIDNYGMYAYAMALALILSNILNYGFNLVTVRELSKNKHNALKINELFNEVFSVKLFLLVLLFALLVLVIFLFPDFRQQKTLYFYTSFILLGEFFSLRWFFLGIEKMKFKAIINLASTLLYVVFVVLLVEQASDYKYIPLYQGAGLLFVGLLAFLWVLKKYHIKIQLVSFKQVKLYLVSNFSSFINLLLPSTFGTVSIFLVGVLGLPVHVSLMQIGVKFTSAFSTINTVLTKVFYSIINRNKALMLSARVVLIGIGIILSFSMFFISDWIIPKWLAGESIEELTLTIKIIKILSPTPFLVGVISGYGINGLLTWYKDRLYGRITLVSFVAMVLFSMVLLPINPIFGGAIALLLGRFIYAFLSWYFFKKLEDV